MRRRLARVFLLVLLLSGAGYLMAGTGLACASFATDTALGTVDMCFVFDCQQGAFGGLFQPCSGNETEPNVFTDCPETTAGAP